MSKLKKTKYILNFGEYADDILILNLTSSEKKLVKDFCERGVIPNGTLVALSDIEELDFSDIENKF